MAAIGLFTKTGVRYQMTIPKDLNIEAIKTALLKLGTQDAAYWFHPEWCVTTINKQEAEDWKVRLASLPLDPRLADRDALLEAERTREETQARLRANPKNDVSEIIKLADKLAGMDWQEDDENEEIRQRMKSLTKGLSPQDVQYVVHRALLMADQRRLRLEKLFADVVMVTRQ